MATIQEARQQVTQARQNLQQQKQQIQEARQEIRKTELRPLTRTELQVRGREDIITRKLQAKELEGLKQTQLKRLDPFDVQIKETRQEIDKFDIQVKVFEKQIKEQKQFEQEVKVAQGIVNRGISSTFAPRKIRELVRKIKEGEEIFKQRTEQIKALRETGLLSKGATLLPKLTVKILEKLSIKKLKILEKVGFIKLKGEEIIKVVEQAKESRIVFGKPKDFGRSFNKATDLDTFTIAIPIGRENGKIRVRDFNFRFEDGKLVKSTATGTALITEKQFLERDKKRRDKNPEFTFGDTRLPNEKIIKKIKEVSKPLTQKQIDILNIKDPLKFFVFSLPELGRTIFEDFVNNPKDRKAIRDSLSKLQKGGDKTIEKLEDTRVKVEEFLDPRQKEFRIETEKNFNILEGTQKVLNADIEKFNKKFVGELSQEQFDDATLKATTFTVRQRVIDQRTFELAKRVERLRDASEFEVETFFKSTLKGIATSPITLAQLGIGVSTRPIKTIKDFTKAVKEFPSTFGTVPFSTAGQLFGTVVGTKLISDVIFASPQLFKAGKPPFTSASLRDALRKGGKELDDLVEFTRKGKFFKDKKGEITLQILLKKKKKKKKPTKDDPFGEFTEELERLEDIGAIKTKNKLIDTAVKGMLAKIRATKTVEKQKQMTLALNKVMQVWKAKGIIKLRPPIFELVRKPTRPIGSKKTASELRIVPQRQLQTARQKKLVSRFRKQKENIELFKEESSQLLKKQRQKLVTKQTTALALAQKSKQTQKDKQATATAFSQVSAQASKLASSQQEALKQSTALASALLSTQTQIVSSQLAPAQVLIGKPKVPRRVRIVTKTIIPKITKAEKEVVDTRLIKAIQKLGKKGVDVIVGQRLGRQKTIGKNLPKYKALRKAQRFVDSNIEASYLLKISGKKAKGKDIKSFNPSFKFRSSKAKPLFVVERRKFRLDHTQEVRQLNLFKGKVPTKFLPRIKKKRKKK